MIIWLRLLRKLLDNIIFNKELSEYNDRIKKEMKQWIELERKVWIKRNYPSGVKKKVFRKELLFQSVLRHAEIFIQMLKGASKNYRHLLENII